MGPDNTGWEVVSKTEPQDDGGWKVVAAKAPPGQPSMSPHKRTAKERFDDNFEEGRRSSLAGAGADMLATNMVGAMPGDDSHIERNKARHRDEVEAYELRSKADPWYKADGGVLGKAEAGLATLGGVVAGGMGSPEAWIGPGKTWLARMGWNAGINAATDVPIQVLQNEAGTHEGFDPWRVVAAGVTGGLVQGGIDGAGAAGKKVAPVLKDAGRRFGDLATDVKGTVGEFFGPKPPVQRELNLDGWDVVSTSTPTAKPKSAPAVQPARAHVDDVWDNLTRQESGGRQADANGQLIRSPKGAGGAAQLMPATAKEVATKLGQPELADLAFQPTEAGRAANEKLGRAYYTDLLQKYGGDHALAAAAYNGGPGRLDRALKKYGREAVLDHLPKETQDYVRIVVREPRAPRDGAVELAGRQGDETGLGADAFEAKLRFDEQQAELRYDQQIAADEATTRARNQARQAADQAADPVADVRPAENVLDNDIPIPDRVNPRPQPETPQAPARDLTDEALDLMRRGKSVRVNRGPSLLEFLQSHGIRNEGGELSNIGLDLWHRDKAFRSKLVRENGRTLEDAAVLAQDHGYLPQRFGADVDTRASPAELLNAMREELAGRPRFASENAEAQALRDHIDDLDQITNELGINLDELSNADIKARINQAFAAHEPVARASAAMALEAPRGPKLSDAMMRFRDRNPDVLQSTRHGLTDQIQRGAVPEGHGAAYGGKSVGDMVKELQKSLGYTHRQGRLRGRRSLGEYSQTSGVVRTKSMRDIETAAHEAAHALEFSQKLPSLEAVMAKHADTLRSLDYQPKLRRRHEGFAEWMRKYVNNPAAADRDAPGFREDFEAALAKDNPKVLQTLKDIQGWRDNWLKTDSVSALKSTISEGGDTGAIADLKRTLDERGVGATAAEMAGDLYGAAVDRLFPIQKGVRILQEANLRNNGAPLELAAQDNPYVLARNKVDAERAAVEDITGGVVPYHGTASEGPSLRDALITAFGKNVTDENRADLDAYLIARRLVPEWDRFRRGEITKEPHLIGKADLQQTIADLEAKYPQIAGAAQQVYEWNQNKLRKTFDAGFISKDTFEKLSKKADYVPLYRDMSDLKGGDKLKAGADASAVPKTFRGSDRDIISPLTSMMEDARVLARRIRENDVLGAFAKMADTVEPQGIDTVIERLPKTQLEGFRVNVWEAVQKKAKELGLDFDESTELLALNESAFGLDPMTTLFRAVNLKPRQGERVVFHWKDGEVHPLQLPDGGFGKSLAEVLNNLNPEMQNLMVDMVAMGSAAVRLTATTLNPEFFLVNLVRDQLDATIKTDVGYLPVVDALKGLYHTLFNTDVAKRYRLGGGLENGTETVTLGVRPRTLKDAVNQKRGLTKKVQFTPNPVRWMTGLADLSERSTRLGVFAKAEKRALKEGASDYGAMVQGAFEARDYYDPQRRGSKTLTANRLVIFLNPYIQGWDKYARVVTASGDAPASFGNLAKALAPFGKRAPKTQAERRALAHAYKSWIWAAGLATMGAGLTYLYADDPEYQHIDSSTRATNYVFKAPWSDQWHRIPKVHEMAVATNFAERWIEAKFANDPKALQKAVRDLEFTLAPPHQIPLLSLQYDLARNRNYAGQKIIPDRLSNVDPEYQYTAYTSELAKMVGKVTKGSPIKIDYWIKGLFSSQARYGLQGFDVIADKVQGNPEVAASKADTPILRRFNVDPNRSTVEAKDFYKLASNDDGDLTQKKNTFDLIRQQNGGDEKAVAYLNRLKPQERAYVIATTFSNMLPDGGKNALGLKLRAEMFHPVVRAQEAVAVISGVERDVSDGTLATMTGQTIDLTPQQRRQALDALAALRVAEMRNALITVGERGWTQKSYGDRVAIYDRLKAVDPRLPALVKGLQDEQGIPRPDVAYRGWNQLRPTLEGKADETLFDDALMLKRLKSSDRKTKREAILQVTRGPQ